MNQPGQIRILCVDDHPLLREGITAIIAGETDMRVVGEASDGVAAIDAFRRLSPDVTLMDLRLAGMSGLDAMIAIRAEFPAARIIILTSFEGDVEIQRALKAGARAYMLKSTDPQAMVEVIRQVHAGRKPIPADVAARLAEHFTDEPLTDREVEVLAQIATGLGNREIAEKLYISEETVKVHVRHIMVKLAVSDRTQAVAVGARRGVIRL
jgi:DNA-binding NarL/FixJ family response regulator